MVSIPVTNCWYFAIGETPDVAKPDTPAPSTTKADLRPREKDRAMPLAVKRRAVESRTAMSSIDRDIRDFVAGRSNGESLLHILYDRVLDEPVPQRLRALLER
jgi:hypothetical protein